ncbi:MAG: YdcF family protein [Emcibacter sp.]|nr:YdcF family protein [Emcibacter sp.]
MMKYMVKYISYVFLALVFMWFGGLLYFIYGLSQIEPPTDEKTDGIVVLTGGQNRLQEAGRLLENGFGKKLFISGVNAEVTQAELYAALGSPKELVQCCIESGIMAQNTAGNAEEIFLWVKKSNISSIRVVTSLEHMPRALVELRRFMPKIKTVAHPVGQWRPENITIISLMREYSKYLVTILRNRWLDIWGIS